MRFGRVCRRVVAWNRASSASMSGFAGRSAAVSRLRSGDAEAVESKSQAACACRRCQRQPASPRWRLPCPAAAYRAGEMPDSSSASSTRSGRGRSKLFRKPPHRSERTTYPHDLSPRFVGADRAIPKFALFQRLLVPQDTATSLSPPDQGGAPSCRRAGPFPGTLSRDSELPPSTCGKERCSAMLS